MFRRVVTLVLLASLCAAAQPSATLLPSQALPNPAVVGGDPAEHSVSWQVMGGLEGVVTGALVFGLSAWLALGLGGTSRLTPMNGLVLGTSSLAGAGAVGAMGTFLGGLARQDSDGGAAARHNLVAHGVVLAGAATAVTVIAVMLGVFLSQSKQVDAGR